MPHPEPAFVSELYSAYAAGRLSPAFALMLETQAAIREDIRTDVAVSEAIAGAMLEDEAPALMSPNAFESALRALDRSPANEDARLGAAAQAGRALQELLDLPEPLREPALEACEKDGWHRLTGGVSRLDIGAGLATHAHLYRIDPGASVPRHSHKANEYTLVLHGGFSDASGSYGPGDIALQTPDHTHEPVADEGGVCIVLAISEGGLRFTGLLGLLQRLSGR